MKKFNTYFGATVSSLLLTIMVIVSDTYSPFKEFLTTTFTHHWIAKSIIVAVSFILAGFIHTKPKLAGVKLEKIAYFTAIASLIAISVFFVLHYLA